MKNKFLIGAAAIAALALCACSSQAPATDSAQAVDPLSIVEDIPTIQSFLMDPVPESDLLRIANAGYNAPSGMNMQPWHFTIISNAETIASLAEAQKSSMKFPPMGGGRPGGDRPAPPAGFNPPEGGMPPMGDRPPMPPGGNGPKSGLGDSPVVILISCKPGSELDAGLACEAMNDMANLLGYGTKIASSVTMLFNGEKKAEYDAQFQIPEGQSVVTAILLGKVNTDGYDAVSSATPRNDFDKVVTFVK
ncbi:MAG: nitroreductase family protein [Bacteroidia bacterium]|nr:nitroreductase family protein [Bacteroidia bacterium]